MPGKDVVSNVGEGLVRCERGVKTDPDGGSTTPAAGFAVPRRNFQTSRNRYDGNPDSIRSGTNVGSNRITPSAPNCAAPLNQTFPD